MKEEVKSLLTVRGTLRSIARVEQYICALIDGGNTELEEKIINSKKSIDDCWKYIRFKAKNEATDGCACIDDQTVFNWAVYYYEDNVAAEQEMNPPKSVNKTVEKTEKSKGKGKAKKGEKKEAELPTEDIPKEVSEEANETLTAESNMPETSIKEELGEFCETHVETHVMGEDMTCIICGKPMREAFAGKPVESIRRWTGEWLEKYGHVFCCKAHKDEFFASVKSEV